MILTNDKKLADKAHYLTTQAKDDSVRYIHDEIGYNFRLTNIQAALGAAQLEQLPGFLQRKKDIHRRYVEEVGIIEGLTIAAVPRYANNNHWMNLLQIDSKAYGSEWEALMARLEENDIQTRPVWGLIHLQKPYRNCQSYKIEKAEELVNNNLCLPSSTSLSDDQIQKVMDSLHG
jgi:dTDP-4-amino-4,6-dideoxygalactose transaminase